MIGFLMSVEVSMKKFVVLICLPILLMPFHSSASEESRLTKLVSYVGSAVASESTTQLGSSGRYAKFSPAAVEDAAVFIGSDGDASGPYFESAVSKVRALVSSDLSKKDISSLIVGGI